MYYQSVLSISTMFGTYLHKVLDVFRLQENVAMRMHADKEGIKNWQNFADVLFDISKCIV